jgi:hypothetical protein
VQCENIARKKAKKRDLSSFAKDLKSIDLLIGMIL